jgi:hypothetical protein
MRSCDMLATAATLVFDTHIGLTVQNYREP